MAKPIAVIRNDIAVPIMAVLIMRSRKKLIGKDRHHRNHPANHSPIIKPFDDNRLDDFAVDRANGAHDANLPRPFQDIHAHRAHQANAAHQSRKQRPSSARKSPGYSSLVTAAAASPGPPPTLLTLMPAARSCSSTAVLIACCSSMPVASMLPCGTWPLRQAR